MTPGNNVIEVVLRLVDEISKPLAGAEAKLAGLKKAALVGGTAAVVAAAAGIGYMVKKLIDAEQSTARLDIAYDNLGKQAGVTRKNLDEYADALLRSTTFSSDVIKQSEALLLTFTKVRGEGFERTLKVAADMATAMGTDLPSAVGRLGRALQQPATGFELLARSGVRFSLTEQKVIEDMVATGDAAGAQAKLLSLLEQRYAGNAAAMRNTLGGALTGLKNQLADLVSADRGSFGSTTAAVEKLTAAIGSPEVKTAANTFGTAIATLTGKLVDYTAAIINGATATGEFIAKWATGNWRGTEPLDVAFSRRDQLKEELSALNPLVLGYSKRKAALEAELKANEKLIQQLQVENTLSARYAGNRAAAAAASTVEGVGDVEERLRKFAELQKDLRTDVQKTADMVKQEMQNIAQLYTLSDAQLAEQGFTRGDLDKAAQALRVKLADAAAKAGKGASRSFTEALQTDLDRMVWAPRIELTPAEELLRGVVAQTATGMELAKKVALDTWTDFVARLQSLLEMGKITVEQMKEFERRYLDQELQPIVVTVPKILPKTEDFMQPFRERMAENIHDAIAGALEGIGTKSGKDVARDFLTAFRSTIAQAGALVVEKALGLDKLATGGGPLGKVLDSIFSRGKRTATGGAPAAGGPASLPGAEAGGCAATCAEQVVSTVAKTTASGFGDIFKQYASNLWGVVKPLISGAWKAITNIVSKIWDFIKTAIAAVRTIATSASASGGSSGGLLGMAGTAIASYFGGSAGGGRIPARKPRKVNEEGPELIVPDVPMRVYNQRQLAFAGATGGMGGGTFTFAPTYNVRIDGGKNDKPEDTAAQFYAIMAKRDAQMEERIFTRLRRNGLGRLSR